LRTAQIDKTLISNKLTHDVKTGGSMVTSEVNRAVASNADSPAGVRRGLMVGALLLASAGWLGVALPAWAELVVSPTTLTLDLTPGALGIVKGDITNTTGFDLLSSDFFGSFSGFPSDALVVEQLLGLTNEAIDDRAITRGLDLFSVQLGVGARAGERYEIEFFFGEAVGGNFGPSAVVQVTVPGTQVVPEPSVAWLVGGALLGLAATRRRSPSPNPQEL
jgi:hypothetical protein